VFSVAALTFENETDKLSAFSLSVTELIHLYEKLFSWRPRRRDIARSKLKHWIRQNRYWQCEIARSQAALAAARLTNLLNTHCDDSASQLSNI
jgi:hypothetical protein